MSLAYELRRRAKAAITPIVCVCGIVYFGYHLVEGERGLYAYTRLGGEIAKAKLTLAETAVERRRLERRVALMRPSGLDTDMLDEQARLVLGLVRRDEAVIFDGN
ncbi:MAG TPA: septum formation initiator family protein [Candidatus Cybelea sp.]|jgi:cell division protein FtsB|nr:septum formation initiator family protein [Candidatus Cybelea sp.]